MSAKPKPAMTQVAERSRAEGTDLLVLLMISKHAYPDLTGAHPTQPTVARLAKKGVRTVRNSIKALVKLGELVEHYKAGPDGQNAYTIVLPDPATAAAGSDPATATAGSTRQSGVADPATAIAAKQSEQSFEQSYPPGAPPRAGGRRRRRRNKAEETVALLEALEAVREGRAPSIDGDRPDVVEGSAVEEDAVVLAGRKTVPACQTCGDPLTEAGPNGGLWCETCGAER